MDIVEQLCHWAKQMAPSGLGGRGYALDHSKAPMLEAAAAEIKRLRADLLAAEKAVRAWHKAALAMRDMSITGRSAKIDSFYIDAALTLPCYGADPDPTPSQRAALDHD